MLDDAPLPLFPDAPRTPSLRPACPRELQEAIASAIRAGAAGSLTRAGDTFLAGLCAEVIADRLVQSGFVVLVAGNERAR